jgi:FkbH-like protein
MGVADPHRCLLVADFNLGNFAGLLGNDPEEPKVEVIGTPYGQVVPALARGGTWWEEAPDCCLVWTRPEGVCESFGRLLAGERVDLETVFGEVDEFAERLLDAAGRVKGLFAAAWWTPFLQRGQGMLDLRPGVGVGDALLRMNLRLADRLGEADNIFLLDTRKWVETAGSATFQPKLWYMGKIPFGQQVFAEAVRDLKAGLDGLDGRGRKLIVVDLDDTLWGGIVGEVGWEQLKLGGHDHAGEAFVDFQRALKRLNRRGILLAIASKNEERVALEAIAQHPEMVLGLADFAGWRIDWGDKGQNIDDMVAELNLGLQSVVFIDDNPAERARVGEALPEVFVPEWPADSALYASTLLGLRCFDAPRVSAEDRQRSLMYAAERQRRETRGRVPSLQEWLDSLELKVRVEELNAANLPRAAQLLNRTNQMNLSTRRLSETELREWADGEGREVWVFHASDRFGDSGLTGLASLECRGEKGLIIDFVLSCRVMGRQIEETMIHHLTQRAGEAGTERLVAELVSTAKNAPCRDFFSRVFQEEDQGNRFVRELERDLPLPSHVELTF